MCESLASETGPFTIESTREKVRATVT